MTDNKITLVELIKKYFGDIKIDYDGFEFDGSKIRGKHTKEININKAFKFLNEVNKHYPLTIKENTIIEPLDEDTSIYLQRYFLGQGFKVYTD